MKRAYITAQEPEEELLGPEDLDKDVATLNRLLAEKREAARSAILSQLDPDTQRLLKELVAQGACPDEIDAIVRAIRVFALAVSPQSYRLERE